MTLADQTGRVFVITGASSGLGAAAARALLAAGAHVVAAVRDPEKGRRALGDGADVRRVDLADLDSVRALAAGLDQGVDVLINNAGIMGKPYGCTRDGFELHLGINHLGHFALTGLLLPRLRDRVVTVSSVGHRAVNTVDLRDPHMRARYRASTAYATSKLANILFAYELQRRLAAAGSGLRSLAAHPGVARTALMSNSGPVWYAVGVLGRPVSRSAATGARPILHAATADVAGGAYVGPGHFLGLSGPPRVVRSSPASHDPELARRLWEFSEVETGVSFAGLSPLQP